MLTEAARVVVIGAGIVGCGVADPLAQIGWREMLVVDGGPFFRTGEPGVTNSEAAHETSRLRGSSKRDGGIMVLRIRHVEQPA